MSHENVIAYSSGCPTGKRGYKSRKDARAIARQMKHTKATSDKGALSTYRCEACQRFHVGHIPHAVKRGIADRATLRHKIDRT